MSRFWFDIEQFADNPALFVEGTAISYGELARMADAWRARMRAQLPSDIARPLILLQACNTAPSIAAYLGALRAGWPVILGSAADCASDSRLRAMYAPNIVLAEGDRGLELPPAPQHRMDADLAVMLSTSGTTGAAKLVRLSGANIAANAASIAQYLGATCEDVAATTLPWHYSYGMSVLHVQLQVGGALLLTDDAITDAAFWRAARECGVSALSFVPVQFDMLEKGAPLAERLPSLRYVTQAGGRLEPAVGRHFKRQGARDGWRLFVMYGQTEAAPRIAYVPPDAALEDLASIGQAIPGGTIRLVDADGAEIQGADVQGELVYEGPNVMMGYAEAPEDLALGQGPNVLRTGDIAVRQSNGFFRIVGRASRFLKINGLRLSLDEIEARLGRRGLKGYCSGSDAQLVVFRVAGDRAAFTDELARGLGLLPSAFEIADLPQVPLSANGKVDYRALKARAEQITQTKDARADDLDAVFARVLGAEAYDPARSFVDHGGDSLRYLEVQLAFQKLGRPLPEGWETVPIRDLLAQARARAGAQVRPGFAPMPMDVLWRILAIVAVMLHHTTPWKISGGAYLMLVFVGLSMARFQSANLLRGRVGATLRTMLTPILVGYFAILMLTHLAYKPVDLEWFLLLGNFDRDINPIGIEPYWFVCAYVQLTVIAVLPFVLPSVCEQVRRHPLSSGLVALGLVFVVVEALRLSEIIPGHRIRHTMGGLELLLVGWCIHFARSQLQKSVLLVVLVAVFARHWIELPVSAAIFVYLGAATTLAGFALPVPQRLANAAMMLASVTLFTYLIHPIVQSFAERVVDSAASVAAVTVILSFGLAYVTQASLGLAEQIRLRHVAWHRAG